MHTYMDSSSSSTYPNQNWLGFSLSNNQLMSSDSSHHHSLFPFLPFNTKSHAAGGGTDGVVDGGREDGSGATDFVGGSPKLEDFLGASANSVSSPPADLCHLSSGNQTTAVSTADDHLYDSELKNIAASFLRDFSHDQTHAQKQLAVAPPLEPPAKKAVDTFGQRTSIYRGVTRHRWTGRYEAHLWDNSSRREGQSRKGRQVYLGGYDKEEKAARAYDLAALKYWGPTTTTNFPVCNYEKELEDMKNMTRQEFVASLRRKSSGFSRGASIYRGVTRHHQHGRWQARIGRVAGNKDLYLGTFSTQEEAAEAYDIAAIKFRGLNAVTNFDMSRYDLKSIGSSNLPVGGMTNKSKTSPDHQSGNSGNKSINGGSRSDDRDPSTSSVTSFASQPPTSTLSFALQPIKPDPSDYWSMLAYNQQNTRNPGYNMTTSGGLFQGTTPFSMDFCSSTTVYETNNNSNNNNVGFLNGVGGNYIQPESNGGTSSSIAFATPTALNSNNSNYYGGGESGNFGNWIGAAPPSLHHSFQLPAKATNVSVFQTPIFGME